MGALDGMNADPSQEILHIYDIACQYHKHLDRRVQSSDFLNKDILKRIIHTAIGSFHVHGHKDTCYFRYSTLYVPGVGIIDGEILETLWSVLNDISRSIRTATLAHRAEVLDDHMNDSNWKKLLTSGTCIEAKDVLTTNSSAVEKTIRKYSRASQSSPTATEYFEQLSATCPTSKTELWRREIEAAEAKRRKDPSSMDVLEPNGTKRELIVICTFFRPSQFHIGKTLLETADDIVQKPGGPPSAAVLWLRSGFRITETQ